jgi:hypothetical protein
MSKATYNFSTPTRRAILAHPPAAITRATAVVALSAVVFVSTDNGQWADAERLTASA